MDPLLGQLEKLCVSHPPFRIIMFTTIILTACLFAALCGTCLSSIALSP